MVKRSLTTEQVRYLLHHSYIIARRLGHSPRIITCVTIDSHLIPTLPITPGNVFIQCIYCSMSLVIVWNLDFARLGYCALPTSILSPIVYSDLLLSPYFTSLYSLYFLL